MREILFRGKSENGKWIEGCLIHAEKYTCILQNESKVHPMDYPYLDGELGTIDGKADPVVPETVGQYTGLTDKNGKKIFEGDIVKWNINFAIVWQDCKFVIKKDINAKPYDYVLSCFDGTEFEVIGNIHDNPELLGGDN